MTITEQDLIELFRKGTTAELNNAIAQLTEQRGQRESERIYTSALKKYDRETEESRMADFFEPGKTYTRVTSRITDVSKIFRCVAVAAHPDDGQPRAFGFVAFTAPGSKWHAVADWARDHWAQGWAEIPDHACANCDGIDHDSCLFNENRPR